MTVSSKPSQAPFARAMLKWAVAIVATVAAGGALADFMLNPYSCSNSKQRRTAATMSIITQSLRMYSEENAAYPKSLEVLAPNYLDPNTPLKDGWMRDFHYESTPLDSKRPYSLRSAGSDGVLNSADDIDIWTIDQ